MTAPVLEPVALEFAFELHQLLTANQRPHWRERHRKTRYLRGVAGDMARARRVPAMRRAQITAWVSWPNRRRRDVHNLMPTLKALVDGLVDAGALPDDSDAHLVGPDPRTRSRLSMPRGPFRVPVVEIVLEITDLGEEVADR